MLFPEARANSRVLCDGVSNLSAAAPSRQNAGSANAEGATDEIRGRPAAGRSHDTMI